ncbi:anthranilate synthase component 1 [Parashewanella spongiae]|uniref:Anthranilate synthase component 1 n=1 Tax=Parashewanella spongiae TaxID=342950 RepID=A0A3A6TY90_9GAMM|nr:anthranilate synthase component 1 [Parashewanella spongiae]MCL1076738.1 anthranilate synthase component 1 [Parashewanella spongiae]RJY19479.1 anthranilate synthase component 1 [Parashewanella spongiae]
MNMTTQAQLTTQKSSILYQDDPLNLYQRLTQNASHTMLLESAEIESKDHLKSIIVTDSALMIRCDRFKLTFTALSNNGQKLLPTIVDFFSEAIISTAKTELGAELVVTLSPTTEQLDEDERLLVASSLDGLRALIQHFNRTKINAEPIFLGGVLSYDLIDTVEPLQQVPNADNDCPDYLFYVAETLIEVDHTTQQSCIISYSFSNDTTITEQLAERVAQLTYQAKKLQTQIHSSTIENEVSTNISDTEFKNNVNSLKQHIIAGDIFQIVPSRSFSLPCPNTLGAYQALKQTNPSPYMFYFNGPDFTLFGASPESALKYDAQTNQVEIYPIAGTRKRGKREDGQIDFDLDGRIELELRLDQKELSEHLMLVDLARNDVARISQSGTRKVAELLKVDRYSHVMHLVSRVTGQLRESLDALHAYQACMNMGTLTGAPKVRASQLIREVEGQRRGSYGGAVGYINSNGDMDTCIVIRSAYVKNGVAHIQAGAGVVYDSDPQAEADETRQKAQAVISAIKIGGGL